MVAYNIMPMLLGLGIGAAIELLLVEGTKTIPDTIQTSYNTIIKAAMLDSFGRPNLKFVLIPTVLT